jgi:predicted acetyltransferase
VTVRLLTADDIEQVSDLSQLAFGYRSDTRPTELRGAYGIDGPDGRLLAVARIRDYEQLWGGRRVAMGGVAGVAVHPDGRGRGLASTLMRGLLPVMRAARQPVSALFPTGVGVYRPVGWEVVGALEDTRMATRDLQPTRRADGVRVRTAGPADIPALRGLYEGLGRNGLLIREGPEFPRGADAVLEHDVVSVAESADGRLLGYASYSRGTGYREGSELRLWDVVGSEPAGTAALLTSLSSWSTVASTALWRGPTDELALHVSGPLPPPVQSQAWMLRIVDAVEATTQRGFPAEVALDAGFVLEDPDVPEHSGGWRLSVSGGRGTLERVAGTADLPVLHVRGLALLYAGVADVAGLLRVGLLDRPVRGLDAVFAGQRPVILDYF